jgi:hypothetical protein
MSEVPEEFQDVADGYNTELIYESMTPKQKLIEAIQKELNATDVSYKTDFIVGQISAYDFCLELIEEILP